MGISSERSRVITKYLLSVKNRGISCDRDKTLQYANMLSTESKERATQLLGKDINYLNTESEDRVYLLDNFDKRDLLMFEDSLGVVTIDVDRMLLFCYWLQAQGKNSSLAEGLLWHTFSKQIPQELQDMRKLAKGGVLQPDFQRAMDRFEWRRCLQIGKKYTVPLLVEPGYNHFTLERHGASQLAYMLESGASMELATSTLNSSDRGLMCTWLPKSTEDKLFKLLASGGIHPKFIDGYLAATFTKDRTKFPENSALHSASTYTTIVRPAMLDFIAFMLENFESEAVRNSVSIGTEARVTNFSDRRITISVRDDINFAEAFPELSKYCEPVADAPYHTQKALFDGYFA